MYNYEGDKLNSNDTAMMGSHPSDLLTSLVKWLYLGLSSIKLHGTNVTLEQILANLKLDQTIV